VIPDASSPAIARLGERLREARLNARLTVREAAARIGLRAHGTLVQYENGNVLPPLDRLAALAQVYDISLASLMVTNDALIPVVAMLEHATAEQVGAFVQLLQHALESVPAEASSEWSTT
jgi:transcriptional regulator with XRE-family HTH domain